MNLQYGRKDTYKFELDKERLKWLSDKTNRSVTQTDFLFNLVDGDFEMLKKLEEQLKNCFVSYCPDTKAKLAEVMSLVPKTNWFSLSE